MEGVAVEIRDHNDTVLPTCTPGSLWIKGDNCMLGYYNAPQATANIVHNGWLNTGDMAFVTTDGFIVLCGRERDLISHKGFKIYPPEIENILTGHSAVLMAAVVGFTRDGVESPVAFVASKMNAEELIPELKALCENNLARYKIPIQFYVKNELPMTATGKLDKKVLRKELEEKKEL
jgi:long-chain acyl-CoA synthetase